MNRQCSNENCKDKSQHHRHVHLISGRAKAAQVYPRRLGVLICEGIAAQKRLDHLGLQSLPIMSVEQMNRAAKGGNDSCPAKSLHEDDGHGLIAFDDVSGQELKPELMVKARREEIAYFREMGVYEKVDLAEAWQAIGKGPIAVRWVDINKGDSEHPNYRSRLVGREFNTGACPELYAATPPS